MFVMFNNEKKMKLVVTSYIYIIKQMHSYGKDCDSLALHTHFFLMSFSLESSKRKKKKKSE